MRCGTPIRRGCWPARIGGHAPRVRPTDTAGHVVCRDRERRQPGGTEFNDPAGYYWLPERMPEALHGPDAWPRRRLIDAAITAEGAGLGREAHQIRRQTHGADAAIMRLGGASREAFKRWAFGDGQTTSADES